MVRDMRPSAVAVLPVGETTTVDSEVSTSSRERSEANRLSLDT